MYYESLFIWGSLMSPAELAASSGNSAWMLVSASLVLLMTLGLALFYGGMTATRAALNMVMMSFGALGVVAVVYILWGWSMSYGSQSLGGLVASPFEFFGLKGALVDETGAPIAGDNGYPAVIDVGFQLTFAAISTAIISGALAGRVKFSTWLVFAGLWVSLVYFPLAHMVWGGGLLGEGDNGISAWLFGSEDGEALIAPIDFAGGAVVHIPAGVAALVLALVVGKRRGFPASTDRPHNLPLVMLGAALLWFGWFGFNGGSAFAADGLAGLAWLNTTVATAAAMLGWLAVERLRDGNATSLGAASGVVAGLVTITPAAGDVGPLGAVALGAIGGALACLAVQLKFKLGYDDSLDVVGVHLVAGLWGTVGVAFVATDNGLLAGGGLDGAKLLAVQVIVAAVSLAVAGVITWLIALALKATMGWRVTDEEEFSGIDGHQHAESAYDLNPTRLGARRGPASGGPRPKPGAAGGKPSGADKAPAADKHAAKEKEEQR